MVGSARRPDGGRCMAEQIQFLGTLGASSPRHKPGKHADELGYVGWMINRCLFSPDKIQTVTFNVNQTTFLAMSPARG
jgi:hypothetical protein